MAITSRPMAILANKPIMTVELNTGGAQRIPAQPAATRPAATAEATEASDSLTTQALPDSLQQAAQIRPEKVAKASALVNDANYPSEADLNRLAGFLARHL